MTAITTREVPARSLAARLHVGPFPRIGEAYEELMARLEAAGLAEASGGWVAIFHSDPKRVPEDERRAHACCELAAEHPLPEGLERITLPAGPAAIVMHEGPYEGLPAAWSRFCGELLPASGLNASGAPCYEVYLNSCDEVPPEALRTELHIPLQP